MNLLQDPKLFNYILLFLYFINCIRWGYAKSWGDSFYWFSAMCITISVTFGFKR